MANFALFIPKLFHHEGGYALVKGDKGGETYRGIARKFHPTWSGWKFIDAKKAKGAIKYKTIFLELEEPVKSFYKRNFWDKIPGQTHLR